MDGFYLAMERFPSATFAMTGRKEECVCVHDGKDVSRSGGSGETVLPHPGDLRIGYSSVSSAPVLKEG